MNEMEEEEGGNESATKKFNFYIRPFIKCWFDREDIFNLLKDDLIQRIQSKLPTNPLREFSFIYLCRSFEAHLFIALFLQSSH